MLYLQKYCQLEFKGIEMDKMEEAIGFHRNSSIKLLNCKCVLLFKKNKNDSDSGALSPEVGAMNYRGLFSGFGI